LSQALVAWIDLSKVSMPFALICQLLHSNTERTCAELVPSRVLDFSGYFFNGAAWRFR